MQKFFAIVVLVLGFSSAWAVESVYADDGNLKAEGLYKDKFYVKIFEKEDGTKNLYLMQRIPHYYEYDRSENPSQYNWCGYAAMKSAVKGVLGKYASLRDFADASINAGYTNSYNDDIFIHHLYYLSYDKVKFDGVYIKNHVKFLNGKIKSSKDLFKNVISSVLKVKGAVIIPYSYYHGYPGHFYVIVGIKLTVDPYNNKSYYYLLRDVALSEPQSEFFDEIQEINEFYQNAMGNSNNSNIKPVINVLP